MTTPTIPGQVGALVAPTSVRRLRASPARLLLMIAGILVLFALVRVISGADQLTSNGTVRASLSAAIPIAMAGLGGLWAERSGVVNIGLEGMLILGTFGAGWIGWQYGPWAGVLSGVAFGAIGGLVHAIATVTFGVDHIVSGVAINILGLGVTQYLASELLTGTPGGGETQSPPIGDITTVSIPGIDSLLDGIEEEGWFILADVAGVSRGLLTDISLLAILCILLVVATYFILWRTAFGLRVRSCGEDPYAAESLGVNVYLHKYIAVIVSGGLAGIGGAYLAIVAAGIYREGQTGGRGFIGLAAMIFGNWRPGGLLAGSGLFGYTDALQLRSADAVHALLLLAAIAFFVIGAYQLWKRQTVPGIAALVAAVGVYYWYASTDTLPSQLTFVTPYVTTLLVLALASQRLRPPKADGLIYRRGEE